MTSKPQPGETIKIGGRRAVVTRIEPYRIFFRYVTKRGLSGNELNRYWDEEPR